VNLLSVADRLNALDRSTVTFSAERCLHHIDQGATCTACTEVCPVQALTPGHPPVFNHELCKSCLACIPTCPNGAFEANDGVPSLLACAARLDAQKMELLCALHPQPQKGISPEYTGVTVRSCLAGLGSGALMALAALGVKDIVLRTDACEDCPWGSLSSAIQSQASEAQQILLGWENAAKITLCESIEKPVERNLWKSSNPPVSRRDFFRTTSNQGKTSLAQAIDNGEPRQPHQPGRNRLRMLRAANAMPEPSESAAATLLEGSFSQLTVSPLTCTACGACARACPTQALILQKDTEQQQFVLAFYPQNCIACGFCVRSCAPQAIQMSGQPEFRQVFHTRKAVLMLQGKLTRCDRCNSLMAARPNVHLCPVCEYRQSHPFGSMLPPGLQPVSRKAGKA
jgi:ferredoxin